MRRGPIRAARPSYGLDALSREINEGTKRGKPTEKEMLKTLLLRSRSLIRSSDQLRRRMSTELQDVEDMIKWIEESGP